LRSQLDRARVPQARRVNCSADSEAAVNPERITPTGYATQRADPQRLLKPDYALRFPEREIQLIGAPNRRRWVAAYRTDPPVAWDGGIATIACRVPPKCRWDSTRLQGLNAETGPQIGPTAPSRRRSQGGYRLGHKGLDGVEHGGCLPDGKSGACLLNTLVKMS